MERIPKEITFSGNFLFILLYLFLIVTFGYLLFQELYRCLNNTPYYKESSNRFIIKFKDKVMTPVRDAYNESLIAVHEFFIDKHGGVLKDLIHKTIFLVYFLIAKPYWKNPYLHRAIYIFILLIPRLIVIIAFLIDVTVYQYFYYLYKCIWLLILPLVWRIFFFLFKEHLQLQMLFTTIFFEINAIYDQSEVEKKYSGKNAPVYEFKKINVSEEVLSHYPFIKTDEDYYMLQKNYQIYDYVDLAFIKIFENTGPIPMLSSMYNLISILIYGLSLFLWSYMLCMTLLVNYII